MLLVIADSTSSGLSDELSVLGVPWKLLHVGDVRPDMSWQATVVVARTVEEAAEQLSALRSQEIATGPVVAVFPAPEVHSLSMPFDDFALLPLHAGELAARIARQLGDATSPASDVVSYGAIELNIATYQASVAGRPLDMTYMEYELLRYFVTNPHHVLSREQLLKEVWRYEYYGGARTVDVHVRRLRAKLGEEHAQLIQTVRSVGYLFGRER
jgi:DNA-binding response OmpR family regulator